MAVQILCTNKNCNKVQPPVINPKTDEVFCSVCDSKIENVTHFTKVQLKALKQYHEPKKVPFGVKCKKCGKEDKPVNNGADIVCGTCGATLDHLTESFKRMLKVYLNNSDKEV